MSKRFIDNNILPKAFRKLEPSLKLHWYYLWNHCDKSGVWEMDDDLFEFENGIEFDINGFKKAFKSLIEISEDKILIKDFIRVNYGDEVKESYNPHKPVLRAISKNNLKLEPSLNQASFKLVDVDEYKEEDEKEDEKEKKAMPKKSKTELAKIEKPIESNLVFPFETKNFKAQWDHWKVFKKKEFRFNYKSLQSEQAALTELGNKSNGDEKTAIAIMHQSMANGWKGFFELKKNKNETASKTNKQIFDTAMESEIGKNFRFK
tara:strand:- start:6989 stop:7774 length:786 start_codon:yes stop_codon:yes gene_type:complete